MALAIQLETAVWMSASVDGERDIGVIATCSKRMKSDKNVYMFLEQKSEIYLMKTRVFKRVHISNIYV